MRDWASLMGGGIWGEPNGFAAVSLDFCFSLRQCQMV
jgi:hypothetical protein